MNSFLLKKLQPNEIVVKSVDQKIVVEAKHENLNDGNGDVFRHFIRTFELPKEYDMNSIKTTLSSDGVLSLKASLPLRKGLESVRELEIQHTNAPIHATVKINKSGDDKANNGNGVQQKK